MDWQRWIGAPTRPEAAHLFIGGGRVACPRRGDVDVDECAGCPYLERIEGARLVCRYRPERWRGIAAEPPY